MSGLYLAWMVLVAIAVFVWALLFIRMVRRLQRQTHRAEEDGMTTGRAGLFALEGFFSDPSVVTERRQLLWLTIVVLLLLLGSPFVGASGG